MGQVCFLEDPPSNTFLSYPVAHWFQCFFKFSISQMNIGKTGAAIAHIWAIQWLVSVYFRRIIADRRVDQQILIAFHKNIYNAKLN